MTGNMYQNMAHGVPNISDSTPHAVQTKRLLCMQDRGNACSHGNNSRDTCYPSIEEAERCASPVDCWLMTPLPQEVVMGNLHDVAETATVATQ